MAGKDIAIENHLLLASCEKQISPKTSHWEHREWNTKVALVDVNRPRAA